MATIVPSADTFTHPKLIDAQEEELEEEREQEGLKELLNLLEEVHQVANVTLRYSRALFPREGRSASSSV